MIVCPISDLGRYAPIIPGVEEAMALLAGLKSYETATYPLKNGRVMVMSGTTLPAQGGEMEAHRKYLDIQCILEGQEVVGWAPLAKSTPTLPFSEEKDIGFYTGPWEFMTITAGNCYVVFPEDAHMPTRHLDTPNAYTKAVVKLAL